MGIEDALYSDPELVALYDALNPPGEDTEFYRRAVPPARSLLDLGCGTGLLTCALAAGLDRVTGVEPSAAMLAVARNRSGADRVRWIEADAQHLALGERFDLVLMTGHVFQVFLDDAAIARVLRVAYEHLAPGGRLLFESRNPRVRAWEGWTPEASRTRVIVEGWGSVEVQHRLLSVEADLIRFETAYRVTKTAHTKVSKSTLRFLPQEAIARHLTAAGFSGVNWFGDWTGGPLLPDSREMIAVAKKQI